MSTPVKFSDYNIKRGQESNIQISASQFKNFIFDMPKYDYDISIKDNYTKEFKPNYSFSGSVTETTQQANIGQDSVQIRDWRLEDNNSTEYPPNLSSNTSNGYVISQSSIYTYSGGSDEGYKAFDNNTNPSWWHSLLNYNGHYIQNTYTTIDTIDYYGDWLQIKFPDNSGIILTKYTIVPRLSFESRRSPRDFVIAGSNDGTNWNLVDKRIGVIWSTSSQTFSITNNTKKYLYYRMIIMRVGNGDPIPSYNRLVYSWNGTFTYTKSTDSPKIQLLLVGGGGGGSAQTAGGGGAGGVYENQNLVLSNTTATYTISVGGGGAGGRRDADNNVNGKQGRATSMTASGIPGYIVGGGGFGRYFLNPVTTSDAPGVPASPSADWQVSVRGSGGGGGGTGTYNGGTNYGGGGGAGGAGEGGNTLNARSRGGRGFASTIAGITVAGGGGGVWYVMYAQEGYGGSGGGGRGGGIRYNNADGSSITQYPRTDATGFGSGGGAGNWDVSPSTGGNGSSGVVYIVYRIS